MEKKDPAHPAEGLTVLLEQILWWSQVPHPTPVSLTSARDGPTHCWSIPVCPGSVPTPFTPLQWEGKEKHLRVFEWAKIIRETC